MFVPPTETTGIIANGKILSEYVRCLEVAVLYIYELRLDLKAR